MKNCPCQSGKTFAQCCEPYVTLIKPAPTAEALMRSRYTAFTLAKVDYIEKTQAGEAAKDFNHAKTLKFCKESEFQGLDILRSYQPFDNLGYVEFVVHYNDAKGQHQHLAELSEFNLVDGQWYYVDGKQQEHHHHHHDTATPTRRTSAKIGRNDPCTCGSGKKYKKCCG